MSISKTLWKEIDGLTAEYPFKHGAILPILHKIQDTHGYLAEEMLAELADYLKMPQVDLFEVATFYTLFYTTPKGKNLILACHNISCYILESDSVLKTIEEELNITHGQTTEDKKFSVQAVSCLGACDRGPVMIINEKLYTHLTPEKVKQILKEY